MEICQSCKQNKVEVIESCDDEEFPYKLCKPCHRRLLTFSLRPLEYFNLAAKHGHYGLLHDDFYDEDGTAAQPEIEVVEDENLTFPKLRDIEDDLEKVVDYALALWRLNNEVINILKQFDKQPLLDSLERRISETRKLDNKIYEIAAKVLGEFASDWVRKEWKTHNSENFTYYAECLAKCLPLDESFNYITDELGKIDSSSKLSEKMICLIHFQSEKSLDWIEQNVHKMQNLSSSWGMVAAASKFSWSRAKKWLGSGRPLSLISLDGLANCSATKDSLNFALWLRENLQKLLEPDSVENMNKILSEYLQNDNVPRTRNLINYVTKNWDKILKLKNES